MQSFSQIIESFLIEVPSIANDCKADSMFECWFGYKNKDENIHK